MSETNTENTDECSYEECERDAEYWLSLPDRWETTYCGEHFQSSIRWVIEEFRFEPNIPNKGSIEFERINE